MIIKHYPDVNVEKPTLEGAKGCTVRWLIAQKDGARNYAMRLFELKPDGRIPLHSHVDKEHEIFVVEGRGFINTGKKNIPIQQGDAIFIQHGEKHSFINDSNIPLKFICVIPL